MAEITAEKKVNIEIAPSNFTFDMKFVIKFKLIIFSFNYKHICNTRAYEVYPYALVNVSIKY